MDVWVGRNVVVFVCLCVNMWMSECLRVCTCWYVGVSSCESVRV